VPTKKPVNNNDSYQDEDDGSGDESGSGDGRGGKNKRRSKNDVDGRDFKCKYCDKTYLSYPALYTHMKQKHSKGPDGEMRTPPTSGRGRGRPRKNVSFISSNCHPLALPTH
jgi:C2H2-type zinc finger